MRPADRPPAVSDPDPGNGDGRGNGRGPAAEALSRLGREERTRLLAALVARFGDFDLAEDIAQEAMAEALEAWPRTGVPAKPLAWLMTTARRRAIDVLRRDAVLTRRIAELRVEEERRSHVAQAGGPAAAPADALVDMRADEADEIPDERLELFFCCAHPSLPPEDRIALTLRFVAGLTTAEVAAGFLVPVTTMQARLTRAKKRIRVNRIPLRVPGPEEMDERLPSVHRVVYLIFTEGYASAGPGEHIRAELAFEAIRLARILVRLLPGDPETTGLLALMLLTHARTPARTDAEGLPVPLADQDRRLWDPVAIVEGLHLAQRAAERSGEQTRPGPYAIQAAIAALHAEARDFAGTDWEQITVLYDMLSGDATRADPIIALNRAVAIGRRDGMEHGIVLLDALANDPVLARHHPFHAARAVTLTELGRASEAADAWARAAECADNPREIEYFTRRREEVERSAEISQPEEPKPPVGR